VDDDPGCEPGCKSDGENGPDARPLPATAPFRPASGPTRRRRLGLGALAHGARVGAGTALVFTDLSVLPDPSVQAVLFRPQGKTLTHDVAKDIPA
jgi:hypothetical protein